MSTSRVLVLGGIRSGKSEFAEALLSASEQVSYLATAPLREDAPASSEDRSSRGPLSRARWQGAQRPE